MPLSISAKKRFVNVASPVVTAPHSNHLGLFAELLPPRAAREPEVEVAAVYRRGESRERLTRRLLILTPAVAFPWPLTDIGSHPPPPAAETEAFTRLLKDTRRSESEAAA